LRQITSADPPQGILAGEAKDKVYGCIRAILDFVKVRCAFHELAAMLRLMSLAKRKVEKIIHFSAESNCSNNDDYISLD
jgi:hypothetical protein